MWTAAAGKAPGKTINQLIMVETQKPSGNIDSGYESLCGFFISDLEFYDVQRVLSEGTMAAICVSMGIALSVLLLASLNIFTSFYAIFTITCTIVVTLGILLLLGWKLNILESIAISVAIGLSVDFSLHYTVAYKICSEKRDRKVTTRFALLNMIGPSFMAALTTGASGAFMIPSTILPYIQIGVFLIIIMSVSWVYATFFLCSLLAIIGPVNNLGQFSYSSLRFLTRSKDKMDTNRQTSSTSEAHELDYLTSKRSSRPTNKSLQKSIYVARNSVSRSYTDQSPSATSAITIVMNEDN